MNPDTMEFNDTDMFRPSTTTLLTTGKLCPDIRRAPMIGSLLAECAASAMYAMQMPLGVIIASPVLGDLLSGACTANSMQHSLLKTCGAEVLSLEDMFGAMYTANMHFWNIAAFVGNYFGSEMASRFMSGLAMVGENSGASDFVVPGIAKYVLNFGKASKGSGTDPYSMAVKAIVNPIATAHWMWRLASRIVVQSVQAAHSKRTVGNVFWNTVYDGRVDFDELVVTRLINTCGGMALMSGGYGSPLGDTVRYMCFSIVHTLTALLDLLSVFYVDVPVYVCVCRETKGVALSPGLVMSNCEMPDGFKPLVRTILDDNGQACAQLVQDTADNITGVFDTVFSDLFLAADHVSSVLDSMVASIDPGNAGDCDNYEDNPLVTTLIPQPSDYWRVCGMTDMCRSRCRQQIDAFEAVSAANLPTRTTTQSSVVESLFFPQLDSAAYNPFYSGSGVLSVLELSSCPMCPSPSDDRCIVVAGFPGGTTLQVLQYCVPSSTSRGVSTGDPGWSTVELPSAEVTDVQFVTADLVAAAGGSGWRDTYYVVAITSTNRLIVCAPPDGECSDVALDAGDDALQAVAEMQTMGSQVLVRTRFANAGTVTFSLRYASGGWVATVMSMPTFWDDISMYHAVFSQASVLLLPYDTVNMKRCYDMFDLEGSCTSYTGFDRSTVPVKTPGLRPRVSQTFDGNTGVFIASTSKTNWLTMLFVSVVGSSATSAVRNSIRVSVSYTLSQGCSLTTSCSGCTQLSVQRLCYAAQQCQVARCVGTLVNLGRPLCAIGGTVQSAMLLLVSAIKGAWIAVGSRLASVVKISGGVVSTDPVSWPDRAFYGCICAAKDALAACTSIVTSTVQGIIITSLSVKDMATGTTTDNSLLAEMSLVMASVTNFLFHLTLKPLYELMWAQKVAVCETSSLVATIFGNNKMLLYDPSIQARVDSAAGTCMSEAFSDPAPSTDAGMLMAGVVQRIGQLSMSIPLDELKHPADGYLTYLLGTLRGLQDVLQTADQKNCRPPNFAARTMFQCPCQDQPVVIPPVRADETYSAGSAFWCSTVMSMLDSDGKTPKYVWNPYSLTQLKAKLLPGLASYLDCISTSTDCGQAPSDPIFDQQQASMVQVFQRCLSNYQAMSWDQGTYILFNATLQRKYMLDRFMPASVAMSLAATNESAAVGRCLQDQKAMGYDNSACLVDKFLMSTNGGKGTLPMDYFLYSNATSSTPTVAADACLTFSGPADVLQVPEFVACLRSYANRSGCDIPMMLWSGKSSNRIPVANQHTLHISDEATRKLMAQGEMEAVQQQVMSLLDEMATGYKGESDMKVTLFSAEGDALHQYFDCVMLGPFNETTLYSGEGTGAEDVVWSRGPTGAFGRGFDLPCSGTQLLQRDGVTRDTTPPFTCGSRARRAAIKYFVRDYMAGALDTASNRNAAARQVVEAAQKLINATRDEWMYMDNLMCTCKNGTTVGWGCCAENEGCATDPCPCPDGYYVSQSVACCEQGVCSGLGGGGVMKNPFTFISASTLAETLFSSAESYVRGAAWTRSDPWLKQDPGAEAAYGSSWAEQATALADLGLFDPSSPVVAYNETMVPLVGGATMWSQCVGLLRQVTWTMPLGGDGRTPKFTMTSPYDPSSGVSGTVNLTYREEVVEAMLLEAYRQSPIYWHYQARYTPSGGSAACKANWSDATAAGTISLTPTASARSLGYSAYTIGAEACHCGWWWQQTTTTCYVPSALCDQIRQLVDQSLLPPSGNCTYDLATGQGAVMGAIARLRVLTTVDRYPCPSMEVSEHWGPLLNSTGSQANLYPEVLSEGLAGFRAGNADFLVQSQRTIAHPFDQASEPQPLECSLNEDPSLADHFVDDLFPVAQGVRVSVVEAYCSRYDVELARLKVYQATPGLESAQSTQAPLVAKWRRRCAAKLRQLSVCTTFDVLNAAAYDTTTSTPPPTCPFSVVLTDQVTMYAIAPNCLLVVWNTQAGLDGIYDPCLCTQSLCDSASSTIIQVPSSLVKEQCMVATSFAGEDFPLPGEIPDSGDLPTELLQAPSVNGARFSPTSAEVVDADLIVDWWPDGWRHPVGYHVTTTCAAGPWRTFSTSWVATEDDPSTLRYSTISADPLLRRNNFGGGGVCRTPNYDMPMRSLNTMRLCTTESPNARADPTVPTPPTTDGKGTEYCAPSELDTPWAVDQSTTPPRLWTVGTLGKPGDRVAPRMYDSWGSSCGPYALKTCVATSDCGNSPLLTCQSGVCARVQPGKAECFTHRQCPGDRMCAGDGICVDAAWQVTNERDSDVSFRSYATRCPTGAGKDTWGTSVGEWVPDVLASSGLCSWRSWFENRRMASRNQCSGKDTCVVQGSMPWNSTAASDLSQSAFSRGVLGVKAHPCDADYQHLDGFVSCSPTVPAYSKVWTNADGTALPSVSTSYVTRTYRPTTPPTLPLYHHVAEQSVGPTYGFTGVDGSTYSSLGLGTAASQLVACDSLRICSLQGDFRVNGNVVAHRLVVDGGAARTYQMNDLVKCGVFGYFSRNTCNVDYAVAPLALLLEKYKADYMKGTVLAAYSPTYPPTSKDSMFTVLSSAPQTILDQVVGPAPTTFDEYVSRTNTFLTMHSRLTALRALSSSNIPAYDSGVGASQQIYFLTMYGAYEVPFGWWYKCAWMLGMGMGSSELPACQWGQSTAPLWTTPAPRVAAPSGNNNGATTTLLSLLAELPGVITSARSDAFDAAIDAVVAAAASGLSANYTCYKRKAYSRDYSAASSEFQRQQLMQSAQLGVFDTASTVFRDDVTNASLCGGATGVSCVVSTSMGPSLQSNGDLAAGIASVIRGYDVAAGVVMLASTAVPRNLTSGFVRVPGLFSIRPSASSAAAELSLQTQFSPREFGCSTYTTLTSTAADPACLCNQWSQCKRDARRSVVSGSRGALSEDMIQPDASTNVIFARAGEDPVDGCKQCIKLDACSSSADSSGGCLVGAYNFSGVTAASVPPGVVLETFTQVPWKCNPLTCGSNPPVYVPDGYTLKTWLQRFTVSIDEYNFTQDVEMGRQDRIQSKGEEMEVRSFVSQMSTYTDTNRYGDDMFSQHSGSQYWRRRTMTDQVQEVGFNSKALKLYANKTLVFQATLMPCVYYGGNRNIVFSANPSIVIDGLNSALPYKFGPGRLIDMYVCEFDPASGARVIDSTRGFMSTNTYMSIRGYNSADDFVSLIQSIMSAASDNAPASCVVDGTSSNPDVECDSIAVNDTMSLKITATVWADDVLLKACESLHNDPDFGCYMYPAEGFNTHHQCYHGEWKGSWCTNNMWVPWENSAFEIDTYVPDDINTCLKFEPSGINEDMCSVNRGKFKTSTVTGGRSVSIEQTSVLSGCSLGPSRMCRLAQDTYAPGSGAACPSVANRAMNNRYVSALSTGSLRTNVISGMPAYGPAAGVELPVTDHVLVQMTPGLNYTCDASTCDGAGRRVPIQVRSGLYYCALCPMVTWTHCTGDHSCSLTSPSLPVQSIASASDNGTTQTTMYPVTRDQLTYLTGAMSYMAAVDVALPALRQFLLQRQEGMTIELPYSRPSFFTSYTGSTFTTYAPESIVAYDAMMRLSATRCGMDVNKPPDFAACSYDSRRQRLRDFVRTAYKDADGVIIPPGHTLTWVVPKSTAMVPAWDAPANRTGMFMTDVLSDKWCKVGSVTDNVCYNRLVSTDASGNSVRSVEVLNPGLLGAFDPLVGCDTRIVSGSRVVFSSCVNCADDHGANDHELITSESGDMTACMVDGAAAGSVSYKTGVPSDLCSKAPDVETTCGAWVQGTLGGDATQVSSVYSRVVPPDDMSYLNPLSPKRVVNVDPGSIGGHFIFMALNRARQAIELRGMLLASYSDALSASTFRAGNASGVSWVSKVGSRSEVSLVTTLYPNSVCASWDCPLRRRSFYAGVHKSFRPLMPSPQRAQVVYNSLYHPTQAPFASPAPASSDDTPIDMALNASAILGQVAWTSAAGARACQSQMDWPYAGGSLRDGTPVDRRWDAPCSSVWGRLPPFRFRYVNSKAIPTAAAATTLDSGGACHMGWPLVFQSVNELRVRESSCWVVNGTWLTCADGKVSTVTRARPPSAMELLRMRPVRRLNFRASCAAPPQYRFNETTPVAPEASYGQLKRWETSRMLANDLRRKLCGNATVCTPSESWRTDTFWDEVMGVRGGRWAPPTGDVFTARPWVSCNGNGSVCNGTISRTDWANMGRRVAACSAMLTANADSLAMPVDVCNMDATMDKFCRTIQDARYRVFEANCEYSGQCRQKLFFYQPSTYESDNGEYVRETVQNFYNRTVPGSCMPDFDTAAAVANNAKLLDNCASVALEPLANALQTARVMVDGMVEIGFYLARICLDLVQLIMTTSSAARDAVISEIDELAMLIYNKFIQLVNAFSDMFYKLLFSGPLGAWMEGAIKSMCEVVKFLVDNVAYGVLCFVRSAAVGFLSSVVRPIVDVLNRVSMGGVGSMGVDSTIQAIKDNVPCERKSLFSCSMSVHHASSTSGILPMPTRCFAGVEPTLGSSLACTDADTCISQDDFSLRACATCPQTVSMTRFGCNTLTKLCTCSVFPVGISQCMSHEECAIQDSSCQFVDSYLQPSYGNIPCTQCSSATPICLVAKGSSGVGQCSCPIHSISHQQCVGVGDVVSADATKLCLFGSSLSSSSSYTALWRSLMSAPCAMINRAKTYCMRVYTSASTSTQMVVGTALLSGSGGGRRRLLLDNDTAAWGGVGEPCATLFARRDALTSVVDLHTLNECLRWRTVGTKVVMQANMTSVSPYFLTTWRDSSNALVHSPEAMHEVVMNWMEIAKAVVEHSESAQPFYILGMYVAHRVASVFFPGNATLLTEGDTEETAFVRQLVRAEAERIRVLFQHPPPSHPPPPPAAPAAANGSSHPQPAAPAANGSRRSLLSSTAEEIAAVYTSSEGRDLWIQGQFDAQTLDVVLNDRSSCFLAETAVGIMAAATEITADAVKSDYQGGPSSPRKEPTWPNVPGVISRALKAPLDVLDDIFHAVFSSDRAVVSRTMVFGNRTVVINRTETVAEAVAGVFSDDSDVRSTFANATVYVNLVMDVARCNFTRVQTCTDRVDFVQSILQVATVSVIASVVGRLFSVPYVDVVVAASSAYVFLYNTYGYSPACTGLIPRCILYDVIDVIGAMVPERIDWPNEMLDARRDSGFIDCSEHPLLGFRALADHVSWILADWLACTQNPLPEWALDSSKFETWRYVHGLGNSYRISANVCFLSTVAPTSMPAMAGILTLVFWVGPAAASLCVSFLSVAMDLLFATIVYVHVDG